MDSPCCCPFRSHCCLNTCSSVLSIYTIPGGRCSLPAAFAPMGAVLLSQFIREMPGAMLEAAYLDTSSQLRVLTRIVAPNVHAGILAAALLAFAESWNMVEQPLILLKTNGFSPFPCG